MYKTLLVLAFSFLFTRTVTAKPNIVFLFADDQRADTIAAYGGSRRANPAVFAVASCANCRRIAARQEASSGCR